VVRNHQELPSFVPSLVAYVVVRGKIVSSNAQLS